MKRTVTLLVVVLAAILVATSAIYVTRQAAREVSTTTLTSVTTTTKIQTERSTITSVVTTTVGTKTITQTQISTQTVTSTVTTATTSTVTVTKTTTIQQAVREMHLGGVVKEISYEHIDKATEASVMEELEALKDLGLEVFNIHLNYDPYLKGEQGKISLIDMAVSQIKNWNKTLVISDSGAQSYWGADIRWNEYKELWRQRVADITERYKPDYYVLVKEPRWYEDTNRREGMIWEGDSPVPNSEWVSLIKDLCSIVKSKSPSTKTAVALVPPSEADQELLPLISGMEELDVIGFDSYGGGGLIKEIGDPTNLNMLTDLIPKAGGKEIMLQETWIALVMRTGGDIDEEAKWVHTVAEFADKHDIKIIIYFYLADRINEPKIVDAVKSVVQKYQTP